VDVLCRPGRTAPCDEESGVEADRAQRPDLPVRSPLCTDKAVEDAVYVGQDCEWHREVITVGAESFGGCERHDGNGCVTELCEVVAHGDHVFLARQSSEVSVKDQHQRPPELIDRAPCGPVLVDKFDGWEWVSDMECLSGGHRADPSTPKAALARRGGLRNRLMNDRCCRGPPSSSISTPCQKATLPSMLRAVIIGFE
jgi:hypothetical protein